jgi:molybdenum cofactor synthesis domain-containing protein
VRAAVLTVSDSVSRGSSEDRSGPAVVEACRARQWEVAATAVLPDEKEKIEAKLREWADSNAYEVILTTGGTGIGPRDVTPEATAAVCQRLIPGLAEEMRRKGLESTPRALLSRSIVGIRGTTLIVNLPGSPKGAAESLGAIADLLPHAAQIVRGARHE